MAWFSPYILADGQVDTRSFDTILADKRFAGKQGEDLAVALWTWLVDKREGFYHFLAGTEEPGETLTADPVKDPLRLLNTYGYGLCGNVAMLFAALYDWAGGRSRVVGIPGHTISEAWWGGAWHLIDCDLRALHYKKTDKGYEIASLRELVNNPDLVANPVRKSDPYYMSDEQAKGVARDCYKPAADRYLPHYFYRLGSMDYVLRPGESLTCYYQPQGRFYWGKDWGQWIQGDRLRSFTGPADKKDPTRRYAAACIRWKPNLHSDLDEVGVSCEGFEPAPLGLAATTRDAIIRYRLVSPYMICGRYEALDPQKKRTDALLVRLNASAAPKLAIHTPRNSRTVGVPLQQDGDEYFADLTDQADLHYEYELAISLPAGAILRGMMVETWCQASAMTLPMWCEPGRTVRLAAGSAWNDLQGRAVLPYVVDLVERLRDACGWHPRAAALGDGTRSAGGQTAGGTRHSGGEDARLDKGTFGDSPTRKILPQDGQVLATVMVEPPLPGEILRLHAMAAMPAVNGEPAGEVVIELATAPQGPFHAIGCQPVASHAEEFHFCVEGLATLPRPAGKVWLRLRSPRPVGVWRVRVDYEPETRTAGAGCATHGGMAERAVDLPAVPEERPLDLLLRWRHDGKLRTHAQRFQPEDMDKPFVPVTEPGHVQPLHLVLSVPSRA